MKNNELTARQVAEYQLRYSMDKELAEPWDVSLTQEDEWIRLVQEGDFDLIIGDRLLLNAIPGYRGKFIGLDHFPISGKPLAFSFEELEIGE